MIVTPRLVLVFLFTIISVLFATGALAENTPQSVPGLHPPAGQVCPQGSFVIGFDNDSNILCSETCGDGVLNSGEACDDGNAVGGDGCPASCQPDNSTAVQREEPVITEPPATRAASAASAMAKPDISKIKPSTVVFGAREATVAIFGTGFTNKTTVLFKGKGYTPSVNQAGTELKVTLATRDLTIGRHAITVSNGPGMETTIKKGLEVF